MGRVRLHNSHQRGQVAHGELTFAGGEHECTFYGTAGDVVQINDANLGVNVFVDVYRPDGSFECFGGNCTLTQTGTHTILISGNGPTATGNYSIEISIVI